MNKTVALLSLLGASAVAAGKEPDWTAFQKTVEAAKTCEDKTLRPVLALADSEDFTGADSSEALSEANEDLFLRCPVAFLQALKREPAARQARIASLYFGVTRADWELGAILGRLRNHPEVGSVVTTHFMKYVQAKAPHEQ